MAAPHVAGGAGATSDMGVEDAEWPVGVVTRPVATPTRPQALAVPRVWMCFSAAVRRVSDMLRGPYLIALFFAVSVANRLLLTIQYTTTSYPAFVNLYWQLFSVPFYRLLWNWRLLDMPTAKPCPPPPQWLFWMQAALGAIDNILVSVATSHLDGYGALQVLLSQARIPVSMVVTRLLFRDRRYARMQIAGALLVVVGLLVTVLPDLDGKAAGAWEILPWIGMFLLHCIPGALVTNVQEKMMEKYALDEYYMVGANLHQGVIFALALLAPSAMLDGVPAADIGNNLRRGALCQFGFTPDGDTPCTYTPLATHGYIVVNILWNVAAIFVVKQLSANVFFLVGTATVPVATLFFSIPGMPASKLASGWTVGGLVTILLGLCVYRYHAEIIADVRGGFPRTRTCLRAINSTLCHMRQPVPRAAHVDGSDVTPFIATDAGE